MAQSSDREPPSSAWLQDSHPHPNSQRQPSQSAWLGDSNPQPPSDPSESGWHDDGYWQPANQSPHYLKNSPGYDEDMGPEDPEIGITGPNENHPTRRGFALSDTVRNTIINATPVALTGLGLGFGVAAVVSGDAVYGAVSAAAFFSAAGTAYEAGKNSASSPNPEQ